MSKSKIQKIFIFIHKKSEVSTKMLHISIYNVKSKVSDAHLHISIWKSKNLNKNIAAYAISEYLDTNLK